MPAIEYRTAQDDDRRFVEETFLDSWRTAHAAGITGMGETEYQCPKCLESFGADYRWLTTPQIRRILDRPECLVMMAAHPSATRGVADLYGWLAVENGHDRPLIVYAYTKHKYRRMGIMRALLKAVGIDPQSPVYFAAKTGAAAKVTRSLFSDAQWKPLLVRFPPPQTDRGSNVSNSSQDH